MPVMTQTKRQIPVPGKPPKVPAPAAAAAAADLAALIAEIIAHHEAGKAAGIADFRRAGEVLIKVKESVGYGDWLAWIRTNLPFSDKRAERYMELARIDVTSNLDLRAEWKRICGNSKREKGKEKPLPDKLIPLHAPSVDKGKELEALLNRRRNVLFPDGTDKHSNFAVVLAAVNRWEEQEPTNA